MMPLASSVMINSAVSIRIEKIASFACHLLGMSSAMVRLYLGRGQHQDIAVNGELASLDGLVDCHEKIDINSTLLVPDMRQHTGFAALSSASKTADWRAFIALPLFDSQQNPLGCLYFFGKDPVIFEASHQHWLEETKLVIESELWCAAQATLDHLTTLLNREAFIRLVNQHLLHHYHARQACLVVFMDLNGFKKINDRYGHGEGDRALVYFSELIKKGFRQTDIASRFGGDEFVLFLPRAKPHHGLALLARFRSRVTQFNQQSGLPYHLEFSAGLTCYHGKDAPNLDWLLRDADADMYKHKSKSQVMAKKT
ncbi:TPA: GGDEF domain-containing protein [Aeromonas veronii]|nr:GGDEF domain-containing protein [Aeromonas veronii]